MLIPPHPSIHFALVNDRDCNRYHLLARGFGALELYEAGYTYAELSEAGTPAADLATIAAVAAAESHGASRGSRSGAGAAVGGVFAVLIALAFVVVVKKRNGRDWDGNMSGKTICSKDDRTGRRNRKQNRRAGNTSSIADVLAMSSTTHINSQFDIASNKAGTLLRGQKVTTSTGTEYLIIGGRGEDIDEHIDEGIRGSSGNRKGGCASGKNGLHQGKPEMLELMSVSNDDYAEDVASLYTNTQGGRGVTSTTLTQKTQKQSFLIPIDAASFKTTLSSTSNEASDVGRSFDRNVYYGNAEVRGTAVGAGETKDSKLFAHDEDDSEMYEPFNDLASARETLGSHRNAEEDATANPYSEPSVTGQLYMTPGAGAAEYEPANDGTSQLYMTPVTGAAEYKPSKAGPIKVIQVYADNANPILMGAKLVGGSAVPASGDLGAPGNENEFAAVPPPSPDFEQPLYMNEVDTAAAEAGWAPRSRLPSDDNELYMNSGIVENAPPLRTHASESKL